MRTTGGRPDLLVAVVGTATDVGKTWATCVVATQARSRGLRVAARKPAQSFDADRRGTPLQPTDADQLAAATGEEATTICPPHRWYPVAMAPPMAADALGRDPLLLDDLIAELRWPPDTQLGFVETAGGVRSPLTHDADSATLVHRLTPDLTFVVADAELGTINATRSAIEALRPLPAVVLLNRYDPGQDLHRRNRQWLEERDHLTVVTDPFDIPGLCSRIGDRGVNPFIA